jgi:uroporphyrinogen decarboxylase
MPKMNSRERFERTMRHESVDRPPIDIAATSLTSMSAGCQKALRAHLGLTGEPRPGNSGVDEAILTWAGTDFRSVGRIVSLPSVHARRISDTENVDCWGVRRRKTGTYWDIVDPPLRHATIDDLKTYPWPEPTIDEAMLSRWQQEAKRLHDDGRYVVVAEHPVFGILEMGCWMCGYDEFLLRMAAEPDFVRAFFDKFFEIQMAIIEPYYKALGPYVDLTTSGDDFGMQTGPILSPEMFDRLVAPRFKERITRTKALGARYYWHHSCGSVAGLLDQIITCGVDILNPVQTSAAGMDSATLKARFGNRIVFWGAVDVQHFLPRATPDEVRCTVRQLIDTLGREGGYVIAPAHNMQDDVPPANIAAWRDEMLVSRR